MRRISSNQTIPVVFSDGSSPTPPPVAIPVVTFLVTTEFRFLLYGAEAKLEADSENRRSRKLKVWDTTELQSEFDVVGFMAPLVVARRKSDGAMGSLKLQANPRFYFAWSPD